MFYSTIFVVFVLGYASAAQITIHFSADQVAHLLPIAKSCVAESGVNPEVLVRVQEKPISGRQFHNFLHCAFSKAGYVDKSGHVVIDGVVKLFPEEHRKGVKNALEECHKVALREHSPHDRIHAFYFCFLEKTPVRMWF